MARKIKWGVIGSCGIAQRRTIPEGIVPANNAELVAVYDVNSEGNANLAQELGVEAANSINELLEMDMDSIYIATPVHLHCEQALACAQAQRHVLCEKPLGINFTEAKKMIVVFQNVHLLLGTAFMMRFHSQHQAALEIIQQGKIGKLIYARVQASGWYPPLDGAWRQIPEKSGGGSLMDSGSHCIDLLEMLFGPIAKVSCCINNSVHNYKSEDSAVAMLIFKNGAIATVDTFFCIPDRCCKNVLELYGSKGSIIATGTIGQEAQGEMLEYVENKMHGYDAQQNRLMSMPTIIAPPPRNLYKAEIEEFSQAIIDGRKPLNSAQIGLQSQKIVAACYKSAKTGNIVEINQ